MEESTNIEINNSEVSEVYRCIEYLVLNKYNLRKNSIPMSIKLKFIFNKVSQEMVCICSEYIVIKSQITRKIYKQLIPDETKFDEIPDESKYYIKMVLFILAYGDLYYFLFDIKKNKEQATYEI
ncbi:hypothetical protein H8356DRAFT_1356664 [Neocallimastix lanati (nom. inval.)]|nr:hypothetical protein H8356DRAFT_1356664 [Neocallimastix sp. JGI-2020a]